MSLLCVLRHPDPAAYSWHGGFYQRNVNFTSNVCVEAPVLRCQTLQSLVRCLLPPSSGSAPAVGDYQHAMHG